MKKPTPAMIELLVQSGSRDKTVSLNATRQLAQAFTEPLRQGIMPGDIIGDIFTDVDLTNGTPPEFPLDFLAPGTEKEYVAYTMPRHGYVAQKNIEGDYVMVPTFETGEGMDWLLRYARNARWDVVARATEVLRAGFVKKDNDDGFHTLLSAGVDRNILVYDADANPGQFTKRLISLAKTVMRRNGGGNSTSVDLRVLTDLYLSPEGLEDIRNWGIDIVDEFTRREIFLAQDGGISRIFSVNLHDINEFGEGQEYQLFYTNQLGGTMASSDVEIALGLDLKHRDSFVHPVVSEIEIFEDDTLHRQRRAGLYAWKEGGWAALDNRNTLVLSF